MLKFVQTHATGGDCTAPYDVILDKPYTVSEFINEVLTTHKNEWGIIRVRGAFSINYRYGKMEKEIPEQYANLSIKKVQAAGGWSAMDYHIEVGIRVGFKKEMETESKKQELFNGSSTISENINKYFKEPRKEEQ